MAKTVVGLYEDFETAQRVVQELVNNGFDRGDISLVASDAEGEYSRHLGTREREDLEASEAVGAGAGIGALLGGGAGLLIGLGALAIPGIGPVVAAGPLIATLAGAGIGAVAGGLVGALVSAGVPEEEARYYAEGVRRGGTLVTVNTTDEMADRAADIMRRYAPVDVERRAAMWREEGWKGFDEKAAALTTEEREHERTRITEGRTTIPLVEEELRIGKRQISHGGVRIHTHVRERPVEETVELRQERVNVEHRRTDRPLTPEEAEEAFKERTFEVSAMSEEAVVEKEVRVVGEIEVDKEVEQRQQVVRGQVRETEVDVERTEDRREGLAAFDALRSDFEEHYRKNFGRTGRSFDDYLPAYRFGFTLAADARYRDRTWSDLTTVVEQEWNRSRGQAGTWAEMREAIREGWNRARGRVEALVGR